jgi:hypothetical protein
MPTTKAIKNTPPITPPTMAPTGVDFELPLGLPLEFPLEEVVEGSRKEFVGVEEGKSADGESDDGKSVDGGVEYPLVVIVLDSLGYPIGY